MQYEGYEDGDGPLKVPEVDDINDYDLYIEAGVMLPRGGYHQQTVRVVGVKRKMRGKLLDNSIKTQS